MTFKHTKFEDSVTMRSLEKLATEKGLIKNDPLKKIAEKKAKTDLKPTGNLTENIMKLCAGLREAGFAKYAEELESTYIMYKKAATECDNDILQQAHPKGSYKLEGVEGDATIETIIDQHLANMKMVNKKPTGKLTNANAIINAVKISLAIDVRDSVAQGEGKKLMINALNSTKEGLNLILSTLDQGGFQYWLGFASYEYDQARAYSTIPDYYINILNTEQYIDDQKLNDMKGFFHKVRGFRDHIISGRLFSRSLEPTTESQEKKTALYRAISLLDNGTSLSWGADKAYNGDLTAAQFHSGHIPSADVIDVIDNKLITPLYKIQHELLDPPGIEYEKNKEKITNLAIRQKSDAYVERLKAALNSARKASQNYRSMSDLRVEHPSKIGTRFDTPLNTEFSGVNTLEQFTAKAAEVVKKYQTGLDNIKQWLQS